MQGYIVLACDDNKYRDMAVNIAMSLKTFDPHRSRCLIHNEPITLTQECTDIFNDFVEIGRDARFVGLMNKARLYNLSPYDQTMYVDADMLLLRPNINAYWDALSGQFFNMTGEKCTNGFWYNMDIANTIHKFDIPYVVRMNSGVFYFEKSLQTEKFFERVIDIYMTHKDFLSKIHQSRTGQYADEPIFGVAMGEARIDPFKTLEGHGSWMVTTWQSRKHVFEPDRGVCYLEKSKGYPFRMSWLSRGWVSHSPNFVHFVNLHPRAVYEAAVEWFRKSVQHQFNG